jgi:hypothetical protein
MQQNFQFQYYQYQNQLHPQPQSQPQSQFQYLQYPQFQNPQFQNSNFGQYSNFQPQNPMSGFSGEIQGGFCNTSNVSIFPSLEKMNKPLNECSKYIINTVNYLLKNHHIGKFLEEIIIVKILHNSFFFFFFINYFSLLNLI